MARQEAIVTPSVMKWAREKAGYDLATAAQRIGRPSEEVAAWEDGSRRPTLAQARKAAQVYRRSLAVFYLPEPPTDFGTLRDFRHLAADQPREYSPELALLVRRVRMRQEWLHDFLVTDGADRAAFVGSAVGANDASAVASSIRRELGVTPADQVACGSRRDALSLWIEKAERIGVSVCREGRVEPQEARGFLLADEYAPFVYVNSLDALVAQCFTLLHELAHLWVDEPGISNLEGLDGPRAGGNDAVEVFCNRVASEALLEDDAFFHEWREAGERVPLEHRIERLSGRFKVSEEAVARRLLDREMIGLRRYRQLRRHYRDRWQAYVRRRKHTAVGGHYYYAKVASNGRLFTRSVLSACRSTFITIRDATSLLGVKANHLSELAFYAGVPMGMEE